MKPFATPNCDGVCPFRLNGTAFCRGISNGTASRACSFFKPDRHLFLNRADHLYLAELATLHIGGCCISSTWAAAASSSRCFRASPTAGARPCLSLCVATHACSLCSVMKACASLSLILPCWSVGGCAWHVCPRKTNLGNGRQPLRRRLRALRPRRSCHASS